MTFEELKKMADALYVHGVRPDAAPELKLKRLVNGLRDTLGVTSKEKTLIVDLEAVEQAVRQNRVTHFLLTLTATEYATFLKKNKIQPARIDAEDSNLGQYSAFLDWKQIDAAIENGAAWGSLRFCKGDWVFAPEAEQYASLQKLKAERYEQDKKRQTLINQMREDTSLDDNEICALARKSFPQCYKENGQLKDMRAWLNGELE